MAAVWVAIGLWAASYPAVAQSPRYLEILRNEDLRPYRSTPSSVAKVIDDLIDQAQPKLQELLEEMQQRGGLLGVLGAMRYAESVPIIASQTSGMVLLNFQGDQPQNDVTWIDRCVGVGTISFKDSNKLRRRLNGKLAPGQIVATRLVVFYQLKSSDIDRAERSEISRDLSAIYNVPHGVVMTFTGSTSENGDVIFQPDLLVAGRIAQSLVISRRITNDVILSALRQLGQDCPVPPPAPSQPASGVQQPPVQRDPVPPAPGAQRDIGASLSTQQQGAIGDKVRECWIKDDGLPGIENMSVQLIVTVDEAGVARLAEVGDADRGRMSDQRFREFAERAMRAVRDPRCSSLPIPRSELGRSGKLTFRFRP